VNPAGHLGHSAALWPHIAQVKNFSFQERKDLVPLDEGERRISADGARLEAFVIPTHEEVEITRAPWKPCTRREQGRRPLEE
jgi:acetate kinase